MTLATDLCPWLGTDQDRATRHANPDEAHLCYAQAPPADVELDYQGRFCLSGDYARCRFYTAPPEPLPPVPVTPGEIEDEVGPPPPGFPWLQALLWAVVVVAAVAVLYFYGSALMAPLPTPIVPPATQTASPTPTPSATVTPAPQQTASPTAGPSAAARPNGTPTPYPDGKIYSLAPSAGSAGWVASDEQRGNHFGDSFLYTGLFDGVIFHGAIQFDLSRLPRGASLYYAALELTGLDARRLGEAGAWEVRFLAPEAVESWPRSSYQDIHNAAVQWSLAPILSVQDLQEDATYTFELTQEQVRDLEQRLLDEHYALSLRLDGPTAGANSLFAWDSGVGTASRERGPRLLVSAGPAPLTPPPTRGPTPTGTRLGTATAGTATPVVYIIVTSTPTPANIVTAAALAQTATAQATTTGTPTPIRGVLVTPTPPRVVTNTPTPENSATAAYLQQVATARAFLTGTPPPTPEYILTATSTPWPTRTPRPTNTPVLVWVDEMTPTPVSRITPTPTPTPRTMPEALRGKILFLSDRLGEAQAFALDPASGRVGLLTDRWPYDMALAQDQISPNGEYVTSVGTGVRGVQIYVTQVDTGISWAITFDQALSYDPVWSPADDLIAYVSQEMGPQGGSDDIFVVDPRGTNKRRLTFNTWEWDKHPTFSPDGSQIVFWSNRVTGRKQLWIMNADGSNQRLLLDSAYNDWDPVWVK